MQWLVILAVVLALPACAAKLDGQVEVDTAVLEALLGVAPEAPAEE